ncbi:MAG: flagellar hook-length control protein FliK [Methylococcales bacterium]|nr:flagellar hook-length control protein FliK [Methylococcales bacterium]
MSVSALLGSLSGLSASIPTAQASAEASDTPFDAVFAQLLGEAMPPSAAAQRAGQMGPIGQQVAEDGQFLPMPGLIDLPETTRALEDVLAKIETALAGVSETDATDEASANALLSPLMASMMPVANDPVAVRDQAMPSAPAVTAQLKTLLADAEVGTVDDLAAVLAPLVKADDAEEQVQAWLAKGAGGEEVRQLFGQARAWLATQSQDLAPALSEAMDELRTGLRGPVAHQGRASGEMPAIMQASRLTEAPVQADVAGQQALLAGQKGDVAPADTDWFEQMVALRARMAGDAAEPALSDAATQTGELPSESWSMTALNAKKQAFKFQPDTLSRLSAESVSLGAESVAEPLGQAMLNPATPATQSASLTLTTPLGHPRWSGELAEQISFMQANQLTSAELKLNPEHLGPVSVRIDWQNEQLAIAFETSHSEVYEAVEAAMPKLRELFQGQTVTDVQLTNTDQAGARSGADSQSSGQQQSRQQAMGQQEVIMAEDMPEPEADDARAILDSDFNLFA